MSELIRYFQREFGVSKPGDITWSHAVNSQRKLENTIFDESIMIVESDIRLSSTGIPVAAHPPEIESDLSFDILLERIQETNKGLKLDFKDSEILTACLARLKEAPLTQPVLLNSDILKGNGANQPKFDAVGFIAECQKDYPTGMLSLGWTTTDNPELGYTTEQVDDMLALCEGIGAVTFPVRACLLPASWKALDRLLTRENYTLSIWNNEPVDEPLLSWIQTTTDPSKTFYDFIDDNKDPLKLL